MKAMLARLFVFVVLFTIPSKVISQSNDFSFRPKGRGYVTVGLGGVQGLRVGAKINTTDRNSLELSVGTVPFLQLSGLKATIYGTGYNWYIRGDHNTTGFFSLLAGYAAVTTTSDEYKGDILLLSPTIGLDYSSEQYLNLFLRMGLAGGFASSTKPKTTFTFDLGAGWRLW